MNGGQIMVVCIVAVVMLSKLILAMMGKEDSSNKCASKRNRHSEALDTSARNDILQKMNEQLDRITSRLAALETIVTDEDRELKREFSSLKSDVSRARKSVDAERN